MDYATIAGILSGIFLFVWAIGLNSMADFVNLPSFLIVVGGTVAGTLINYPISKVLEVSKIIKNAFTKKGTNAIELIRALVELADKARKEGLLALEDAAYKLEDSFLQKGILLVVDGADPELVRNILETELAFLEDRHKNGQSIFETMGSLAPAFGMIGTLIGLIQMLKTLDDPSSIGPGMALALLTTFYGALLANLLFIPIAGKLKIRSNEELLAREIMIEGILSIQAGENPRIIQEKLMAFLPPSIRNSNKEQETVSEALEA